jgi:hypothetical protein
LSPNQPPNQHRELHTQKTIDPPSSIVDMPLPQERLVSIIAFMARESMPPPDNTTGCTPASPTVMCCNHRLSPDNTAPPHHPQMPHSSGALSVALRPPNTPTKHRHPLKADRQCWQLLPQMVGATICPSSTSDLAAPLCTTSSSLVSSSSSSNNDVPLPTPFSSLS